MFYLFFLLITLFLQMFKLFALSLNVIKLQEFYRLRSSLKAKQEHASLLEDFKEFDRTRLDLEQGVDSEQHALLKERSSISRSAGHVSDTKHLFCFSDIKCCFLSF